MKRQPAPKHVDVASQVARLRDALGKRKMAEVVDLIADLARGDRKLMRRLEETIDVVPPFDNLVAQTRRAIADATDFDERQINYNFDYDYQAYSTVQRNLSQLVKAGCLDKVMELSLELMKAGSYQVEMSDEGLMTEDIAECLLAVVKGLKGSDIPAQQIVDWCDAMKRADRVGFVCERELKALREHFVARC